MEPTITQRSLHSRFGGQRLANSCGTGQERSHPVDLETVQQLTASGAAGSSVERCQAGMLYCPRRDATALLIPSPCVRADSLHERIGVAKCHGIRGPCSLCTNPWHVDQFGCRNAGKTSTQTPALFTRVQHTRYYGTHTVSIMQSCEPQTFTLTTDMRQREFIERFQLPGIGIFDARLQQSSRAFVELVTEAAKSFNGQSFDQNRALLARGYSRTFQKAGLPLNSAIERLACTARSQSAQAGPHC